MVVNLNTTSPKIRNRKKCQHFQIPCFLNFLNFCRRLWRLPHPMRKEIFYSLVFSELSVHVCPKYRASMMANEYSQIYSYSLPLRHPQEKAAWFIAASWSTLFTKN